ncbi:hypothetical protein KY285_010875 [Solanum tuberosum]|nr:hypothetical protein KY289_011450 [Solanum tuberosum]KAH0735168.1 hypothetical protein KY285_010875 [Solanum tuberosum]
MINGETTSPFGAAKGPRQGDPISPYLFSIAMECLSRKLNDLNHVRGFTYHPRCAKLNITHLSFVNDLLLFSKGDFNSVATLYSAFGQFSTASGSQANLGKSAIYFGGMT